MVNLMPTSEWRLQPKKLSIKDWLVLSFKHSQYYVRNLHGMGFMTRWFYSARWMYHDFFLLFKHHLGLENYFSVEKIWKSNII